MFNRLRTLLITLVLVAVAAPVLWTPAHARLHLRAIDYRSHYYAGVMVGSSRGVQRCTGEPDGGATKNPATITSQSLVNDSDPVVGATPSETIAAWLQRIGMLWMARSLGVR